MADLKRKHVVFEADAEPATSAAPTGPVIHPSRMAGNAVLAKAAGPGEKRSKKEKVCLLSKCIGACKADRLDCSQGEILEGQGKEA